MQLERVRVAHSKPRGILDTDRLGPSAAVDVIPERCVLGVGTSILRAWGITCRDGEVFDHVDLPAALGPAATTITGACSRKAAGRGFLRTTPSAMPYSSRVGDPDQVPIPSVPARWSQSLGGSKTGEELDTRVMRRTIDARGNAGLYLANRGDRSARYASFDHCFNYFRGFYDDGRTDLLADRESMQVSCLRLVLPCEMGDVPREGQAVAPKLIRALGGRRGHRDRAGVHLGNRRRGLRSTTPLMPT